MALQFGLLQGTVPRSVTRLAKSLGYSISSELRECQSFVSISSEICKRYGLRGCLLCAAVDFGFGDRIRHGKKSTSRQCETILAATSGQNFISTEVAEKEAAVSVTLSTNRDNSATTSLDLAKLAHGVPGDETPEAWDATVPSSALIRGSLFKGIVSAIHPYGVFVRFGAYTDGLVHISKLSSGYVRNVNDVVSVGQEVSVIVLNVEQSSGRIALSMVLGDDNNATMANTTSSGKARDRGRDKFC